MRVTRLSIPFTCAFILFVVVPSPAQERLLSVPGGGLLTLASAIGDVDGDGAEDFALIPHGEGGRVYSGATGQLLSTFSGMHASSLAGAGDVNNDGVPDILVGTPDLGANGEGYVEVLDASNGAVLMHIDGAASDDQYGISVAGVGDLNGDDHDDFAVGAMAFEFMPDYAFPGRFEVRSGADGSVLHSTSGSPGSTQALGRWVSAMGDLDGDEVGDVLGGGFLRTDVRSGTDWHEIVSQFLGGAGFRAREDLDGDGLVDWVSAHPNQSQLRAFSGVTGNGIWTMTDEARYFDIISDLDGDEIGEIVSGNPQTASNTGSILCRSGADASLLFSLSGLQPGDGFGIAVNRLGDTNGDGIAEFLVADQEDTWVVSPVSICDPPPTVTCAPAPNSAFPSGCSLQIAGSADLGHNDFTLVATNAVPAQPGLFFAGPGAQNIPFGNGTLCVIPPFERLGTVFADSSGPTAGQAALSLDLSSPGSPFHAGETWNFQFWYRDPQGGGWGYNLSNGLEVTFCP